MLGALRPRWPLWTAAGIVGLLGMSFALVLLLYPQLGRWAIRNRVLPRLEARLDRSVQVRHIRVERGRVVLEGVTVAGPRDSDRGPLATIDRISAEFDFWPSLRGTLRVRAVDVAGARGLAVRRADGSDNFADLARRLGVAATDAADDGNDARRTGLGLRPDKLTITGAALALHDEAAGVTAAIADIDATADRTTASAELRGVDIRTAVGPSASLATALVTAELAEPARAANVSVLGGRANLWPGMTLTGIRGTIAPGDDAGQLAIDLQGSYGGSDETLWTAQGRIDPAAETGAIHLAADKLTLDRIRSVLDGSALVDVDQTSLAVEVDVTIAGDRADVRGDFSIARLNVFHPMLAQDVVRDIGAAGTVEANLDRASRTLTVSRADLRSRDVAFQLTGSLQLPGGLDPATGDRRARPRATARLVIPPVPCQTMLRAIPAELMPQGGGFVLRGTFDTDVRVDIDWADLQATVLDGSVGIFKCKVKSAPEESDVERLAGSFTHHVEVERDKWIDFVIGPENPEFVPLWDVSPYLLSSLMTTEDSKFYDHRGFIVREFRTALIKNLEAGYFRYGASSITMQTVKNVLLYRDKTLSRKLQELFLTWYIEQALDKDRILEIYVNAIEYGPGLYGIGPAARHFFGKHPRDITPVEAAYFSTILPAPKRRYRQFCADELWRWTQSKMARILALMHKRGRLTDEEYEVAQGTPLVFDRSEADTETIAECKRRVRHALKNARPTNPLEIDPLDD